MAFFNKSATHSGKRGWWYQRAITLFISLAVIVNLLIMLITFNVLKDVTPVTWTWLPWASIPTKMIHLKSLLSLFGSVFFQIATVVGAMFVVNDYQRRRVRYRELHDMLAEWDKQIAMAQTWSVVMRIAESVEKALLAEVIEWKSLILHHKLPRK
jgi:hypothetical protein